MFKKSRFERQNFTPASNYHPRDTHNLMERYIQYKLKWKYDYGMFARVICAEHYLRATIQREEALKAKIEASKKAGSIEEDRGQLGQLLEELESLQRKRSQQEREPYEAESMIPERPLKRIYDKLRQNPNWYMRKELVQDCIARGGCCSRSCKCCSQRPSHSKMRRGTGHCTVECLCCLAHRGFEIPADEKKEAER